MSQVSYELPQKLFYRIQEVSRITGVKPYVLRYWEAEFPTLRPEKGPNDQRRYRPSDIVLVQKIKKLLYEEKFTIAGARKHIEAKANGPAVPSRRPQGPAKEVVAPPPKATVASVLHRLGLVRKELIELQAFVAG